MAEALGSLDEATLRGMYMRASQRLEHLPSAIVNTVSGAGWGGGSLDVRVNAVSGLATAATRPLEVYPFLAAHMPALLPLTDRAW